MSEQPTNTIASIHARLTNEARKINRPFSEELQYYGMERFLYRLSMTQYAQGFILKGGLLFHIWDLPLRRPTRDMDFLSSVGNEVATVTRVVHAAINIPVMEDGIKFDPDTLMVEDTQVDADQNGIRVKFTGFLGRARIPMQIDIGFSDEITSEAKMMKYPTLLTGMAGPNLKISPVESIISEKFHAMQRYAELPSRWKDYYDIWLITKNFKIKKRSLQKAIAKTFEIRASIITTGRPLSLSVEFARKHDGNWNQFLKRSGLENKEINDLLNLVEGLWIFLGQPLQELADGNKKHLNQTWLPEERMWK